MDTQPQRSLINSKHKYLHNFPNAIAIAEYALDAMKQNTCNQPATNICNNNIIIPVTSVQNKFVFLILAMDLQTFHFFI